MTRAHFHPLTICDIRSETPDTISVAFTIPEDLADDYAYQPGQHLSLKLELDGEELRRSYSICSAPSDAEVRVAIKRHPHGVFSNHANDHFKVGDVIEVMAPQGRFTVDCQADNAHDYLLCAAGSGITPMMSILGSILETEPNSRVTLVYGNRDTAHIIFKHRLHAIKNRYLERINIIHVLSREPRDSALHNGHINTEKLHLIDAHVQKIDSFDAVYLCGPQAMIKDLRASLTGEFGLERGQVHLELFGIQAERSDAVPLDTSSLSSHATVQLTVDGRQSTLTIDDPTESILDAALRSGVDLPFACKGGVCATCRARITEGEVRMETNYALDEAELEQGFVLTCQSHPVSDEVSVDFDQV